MTVRALPLRMSAFARAVLNGYTKEGAVYHTLQPTRRVLSILEDDMKVRSSAELERDDIVQRFKECCGRLGFADSTTSTWLMRLYAIIRRANKKGLLSLAPDFPVIPDPRKLQRSDRSRPPAGMAAAVPIVVKCARRSSDFREACAGELLDLIFQTGAPMTPLLGVLIDQVDLENRAITVDCYHRGMPGTVLIPAGLVPALRAWSARATVDYFFPRSEQGGRWHISGRAVGRGPHPALRAICLRAGVEPFTWEQVRRLYSENSERTLQLATSPGSKPRRLPAFTIGGPDDHVVVFGVDQGKLPRGQYDTFKAIVEAGEPGIEPDVLTQTTGKGRATKTVKTLMDRSEEFQELIERPGRGYPGMKARYRIRTWWMDQR